MTSQPSEHDQTRALRLTIRTRRTLDGEGEQSLDSTVYCPEHERSIAVADCEACERFRGLHFDPATRASSVVCAAASGDVAPAEEAALRGALGGLPDPTTPLADIMSTDVVCVRAEVPLEDVRALMVAGGCGGVPVVDGDGKPIGIISRADVLRSEHEQGGTEEAKRVRADATALRDVGLGRGFHVYEPEGRTAADVMSPLVLSLHESSNIGQASALMAYEGVHRLPVLSDDGRVVGILSSLDVLRWLGRRSGYLIPPGNARRHG